SFAKSLLDINKLDSYNKLKKQMKDLLIDPWNSANKMLKDLPPHLVVVDALDEIQNGEGSEFLKELLETVANDSLPGFKFLITSRPDPKIADLCKSFSSNAVCHLYNIAEKEVDEDILIYFKDKLPKLKDDIELNTLVQKANGLFIYASTAVKYIRPTPDMAQIEQKEAINQLLHFSTSQQLEYPAQIIKPIEQLYSQILSEALAGFCAPQISIQLEILRNILCAEKYISTYIAAQISDINDKDIKQSLEDFMKKLHSVLYIHDEEVF
ncbi:hypothetical protein C0993_010935, partial [Termitomyces sp. T159_Od127]